MKDSMVTITLFISLLLIRATKAMFTFHLLTTVYKLLFVPTKETFDYLFVGSLL
jgi:hypothetical protein